MKKHLFIILLFLMSFLASLGQTNVYHPFPESNAVWTESFQSYSGQSCPVDLGVGLNPVLTNDKYSYTINGDTIINGTTYHKIYKTGTSHVHCNYGNSYNVWTTYNHIFMGAFRQDIALKKVFRAYNGGESVFYNFNLIVGSTLGSPVCATVTTIDSILIGTSYRKRFNLSSLHSIIEGIGSTSGLFDSFCPFFESGGGLTCFIQNGSTLYPDTINACQIQTSVREIQKFPKYSISPNPSSGIYTIYGLPGECVFEVFDINGKSVYKKSISENSASIDLTKNNKGIYYYRVIDSKGSSAHGIIVLE